MLVSNTAKVLPASPTSVWWWQGDLCFNHVRFYGLGKHLPQGAAFEYQRFAIAQGPKAAGRSAQIRAPNLDYT